MISQAIRDLGSTINEVAAEAAQWLGVAEPTNDFKRCCLLALYDWQAMDLHIRSILTKANPYRRLALFKLSDQLADGQPPERIDE